jgi:succinate dehydrogenase/fumarate reductase-like Fe-S protein
MTAGQLHALALLGWALVLRFLKNVFGRAPRGLARFRANFDPEGLTSLSPSERTELPAFGRCIACGLCNAGDADRVGSSKGAYPGTMALMLASTRNMPDFIFAEDALRFIDDEELAAKERICPTAVPMRKIAAFVRAHGSAAYAAGSMAPRRRRP